MCVYVCSVYDLSLKQSLGVNHSGNGNELSSPMSPRILYYYDYFVGSFSDK